MKQLLIIFLLLLVSCQNSEKDKEIPHTSDKEVSETSIENFNKLKESKNKLDSEYKFNDITYTSKNYSASIKVGYLTNPKWSDTNWVANLKNELRNKSYSFNTILVFNKLINTPDVSRKGMDYSLSYDKHMIAGYWEFPSGVKKFCWGGVDSGNNFKHCNEY